MNEQARSTHYAAVYERLDGSVESFPIFYDVMRRDFRIETNIGLLSITRHVGDDLKFSRYAFANQVRGADFYPAYERMLNTLPPPIENAPPKPEVPKPADPPERPYKVFTDIGLITAEDRFDSARERYESHRRQALESWQPSPRMTATRRAAAEQAAEQHQRLQDSSIAQKRGWRGLIIHDNEENKK